MKRFGVLLLTLSSITPAASVFIMAPSVAEQAGTGATLAFVAGALISLFVAFAYAELASAFPLTGGEYAVVGRILGPMPGFIILGLNIATLIFTAAVVALGLGDYLSALIPDLSPIPTGIVCVIFTTLCGILNLRTNAKVTGTFLVIEMVVLFVLAALGLCYAERPVTELLFNPVHLGAEGGLEPATLSAIGLATVVANFAYNGYGNAIYLGEEMQEAPQHLGRVIVLSLLIAVLAEAVPVTAMLMGAEDLPSLLSSHTMISDFIESRGGTLLKNIMSLGIALAIINANIATILLIGRQVYSTGRDGVWAPAINRALMKVHPTLKSPWVATLVPGVLAALACLIGLDLLLVITGTSLVVVYASLCAAVIMGRIKGITDHGIYRMPFFPLPAIVGLVALAGVIYANSLDPDVGCPSLYATGGMMALAAIYYLVFLRRRGWTPQISVDKG